MELEHLGSGRIVKVRGIRYDENYEATLILIFKDYKWVWEDIDAFKPYSPPLEDD